MASRNPSKRPFSDEAQKYPKLCPGGGLLIAWQLKGKKVLIVGGGPVAAGKCTKLTYLGFGSKNPYLYPFLTLHFC